MLNRRVFAKKRLPKSLMPFEVCAGIPYGNGEDFCYVLVTYEFCLLFIGEFSGVAKPNDVQPEVLGRMPSSLSSKLPGSAAPSGGSTGQATPQTSDFRTRSTLRVIGEGKNYIPRGSQHSVTQGLLFQASCLMHL